MRDDDWREWSDRIFTAISTGDFDASNYREALMLWIESPEVPRGAIAHADKRLEEHYAQGAAP